MLLRLILVCLILALVVQTTNAADDTCKADILSDECPLTGLKNNATTDEEIQAACKILKTYFACVDTIISTCSQTVKDTVEARLDPFKTEYNEKCAVVQTTNAADATCKADILSDECPLTGLKNNATTDEEIQAACRILKTYFACVDTIISTCSQTVKDTVEARLDPFKTEYNEKCAVVQTTNAADATCKADILSDECPLTGLKNNATTDEEIQAACRIFNTYFACVDTIISTCSQTVKDTVEARLDPFKTEYNEKCAGRAISPWNTGFYIIIALFIFTYDRFV
ncbi:hypothetical protein SNE40_008131 [Patella caerulea]|uniref:Uncharacterized protein n=1 Tax=Patella caerulea TaxID=87958 RepID=A0AAN8PUP9_PATCE